MKIGIICCYNTYNYGSRLQSYALQRMIISLGYDCEIIQYDGSRKKSTILCEKLSRLNRLLDRNWLYDKLTKRRKDNKQIESIMTLKRKRFMILDSFNQQNMVFSAKEYNWKSLKECTDNYDIFIIGSDQIWNPLNINIPYNMASFVPKEKHSISYASSFGVENIKKSLFRKYRKFLSPINYISVRENSGKILVKKLLGRDATITVDPTLLLPIEVWHEMEGESNYQLPHQKYILCYFLGENKMHRDAAKRLGNKFGCLIVDLPNLIGGVSQLNKSDTHFEAQHVYDVAPGDLLKLINNAYIVITDSFHATIFSFLMKTKVITFKRYSQNDVLNTNNRLTNIYNYFMSDSGHIFDGSENTGTYEEYLRNYQISYDVYIDEQKKSADFLKNAIAAGFNK